MEDSPLEGWQTKGLTGWIKERKLWLRNKNLKVFDFQKY
jgi:hypothetical protein